MKPKSVFVVVEVPGVEDMSDGSFWKSMLVKSNDDVFVSKSMAISHAKARLEELWMYLHDGDMTGLREAINDPVIENNYIAYAVDSESGWHIVVYELNLYL